jgi:cellulose synthase/poly-beta-1,6-N-acetylglucosamine synthase-like glycosyltransferase
MIRDVGILVPARDEQQRISACLRALADARARLRLQRPSISVRVVVVLDRCTDATAAIAAAHGVATVVTDAGCVGLARATGSRELLGSSAAAADETWLASTDADSVVPPEWLVGMIRHAEAGSHLVVGTALPGPGLAPEVERRWLAAHVLREGHPHVHGANLGVRGDAYLAAGGWPHLASGEDEGLVRRAAAAGVPTTRTAAHPVRSSTRLAGRAPRGFSSYLRGLL